MSIEEAVRRSNELHVGFYRSLNALRVHNRLPESGSYGWVNDHLYMYDSKHRIWINSIVWNMLESIKGL